MDVKPGCSQGLKTQTRVNKLVPKVPGDGVLPGLGQTPWSKKKKKKFKNIYLSFYNFIYLL